MDFHVGTISKDCWGVPLSHGYRWQGWAWSWGRPLEDPWVLSSTFVRVVHGSTVWFMNDYPINPVIHPTGSFRPCRYPDGFQPQESINERLYRDSFDRLERCQVTFDRPVVPSSYLVPVTTWNQLFSWIQKSKFRRSRSETFLFKARLTNWCKIFQALWTSRPWHRATEVFQLARCQVMRNKRDG